MHGVSTSSVRAIPIPSIFLPLMSISLYHVTLDTVKGDGQVRNKSWKPECVGSFNMGWWILVFYPELETRDKIYYYTLILRTNEKLELIPHDLVLF